MALHMKYNDEKVISVNLNYGNFRMMMIRPEFIRKTKEELV